MLSQNIYYVYGKRRKNLLLPYNIGQKSPIFGTEGHICRTFEFTHGIFGVKGKSAELVDSLSFYNA